MLTETQEFNWQRKIWHASGSLLMIAIFFLWQGQWYWKNWSLAGNDILMAFAWLETLLCVGVDIIRYHSEKQREAIRRIPLFGKWIRKHEERGFNTSSYFVLSSALLITAYRLGYGSQQMLIAAILVLGLADPLAALARYWLSHVSKTARRLTGLTVFALACTLVIFGVREGLNLRINWPEMLLISLLCALIETYTPSIVKLVRPLTRKVQRPLLAGPAEMLTKLYPDDNLLIPLVIWLLAFLLADH